MRLLITRGAAEGAALARALEARGHRCLLEPLFEIHPVAVPQEALRRDLEDVQALLFTSANGVRAFAALEPGRAWPVFAVGDATAAAARGAGFATVESAGGAVEDLAALAAKGLRTTDGPLFHAAASAVAGDLKGALEAAGFAVRRRVLYEARPAQAFSPETGRALTAGAIDAVLFFSPRTGASFVSLARTAGLGGACGGCHAVCLSAAVADRLTDLPWAGLHVARRPTTESLISRLETLAASTDEFARRNDGSEGTGGSTKRIAAAMAEGTESDDAPAKDRDADRTPAGGGSADAPALQVIGAFGGIRPMAGKLAVAVSTVQGWRERAAIPAGRHADILRAARDHNIALDQALLNDASHPPAGGAPSRPESAKPRVSPKAAPQAARATSQGATSQEPAAKPAAASAPSAAAKAAAAASGGTARTSKAPSGAAAPKAPSGPSPEKAAGKSPGPSTGSVSAGSASGSASGKPPGSVPASSRPAQAAPPPARVSPARVSPARASPERASPERASMKKRDGLLPGFLLGAVVAAAVFLGTVVTREHWEPVAAGLLPGGGPAGGPTAEETAAALDAALETRLAKRFETEAAALEAAIQALPRVDGDALSRRLDGLERQFAARPADSGDLTALEATVRDLQARLAAAEASGEARSAANDTLIALQADRDALAGSVAALKDQLAELSAANAALQDAVAAQASQSGATSLDRNVALVLALGQLRDALRGAGGYGAELAQVQSLMEADDDLRAAIAPLTRFADSGVPTLAGLQRSFPAMARAVVAAGQGGDSDGLFAGVVRSVSSIVTVRPVGEVEGGGAGPAVARAEARLRDGDLAGALAALEDLTGRAAAAAAEWRGQAEVRLAADRAVAALAARAIGQLAPAGG